MKKFYIFSAIVALFLVGCYPAAEKGIPLPVPEYRIDEETEKRINRYLSQVEIICQNSESLDAVGQSTMTQTARLIDVGEAASPMLVAILRDKSKDWKFRYWACDLLGYIPDEKNVLPLIAIIEDPLEEEKIRLCALEAVVETGNPEIVEYLEVAEEIVENNAVKEEIKIALEKLGRKK